MSEETLHWSEQAKVANPTGFAPLMSSLRGVAPQKAQGRSWGGASRVIIVLAAVVVVGAGGLGGFHLYNKLTGNGEAVQASALSSSTASGARGVSAQSSSAQPSSAQVPSDWAKHTGSGAEIYLPPSFDLAIDSSADMPAFVEEIRARGSNWEAIAQTLENTDFSSVAFWVADSASMSSGFVTNMNAVHEGTPRNLTLDQYAMAVINLLPPEWEMTGKTSLSLGGREAMRMMGEVSLPDGSAVAQLVYFVKAPSEVWVLSYSASATELQTHLSEFEKSAATFRVVD